MKLMFAHENISPLFETRKVRTTSQVDATAMAALVIGDAACDTSGVATSNLYGISGICLGPARKPSVCVRRVGRARRVRAAAHPDPRCPGSRSASQVQTHGIIPT